MNGTLQLSDGPAGMSAGPFAAVLGTTLAVGATEPVTITLDKKIPAGPWHAQVNLASGLVQRSAGATITFPAAGTSPAVSTRHGLSLLIIILLIVIVLLLLGTIFLLVARQRSRRDPQPNAQPLRTPLWNPSS